MNDAIGDAVDNIEIGGRNLALGTDTAYVGATGTSSWLVPVKTYDISDYGRSLIQASTESVFTVSFDYEVTNADAVANFTIGLTKLDSANTNQPTIVKNSGNSIPIGNSTGHAIFVFKPKSVHIGTATSSICYLNIEGFGSTSNRSLSFRATHFKVEQGNTPTAWTPAPEDVQIDVDTANTAANNAASSASAAASSASAASTSASNASTSASNASTSASNAADSAMTATNKASAASTSATNAANSASAASTSATNASNSATTASNQASAASTSATNAANSASAASTSATDAANSATAAAEVIGGYTIL